MYDAHNNVTSAREIRKNNGRVLERESHGRSEHLLWREIQTLSF
jgi:hypothetical protein